MERTVGNVKEGFQLVVKADGSYLTVYPATKDNPAIDLETLKQRLEEARIADYDELQVARLVRAADGFEVKLDMASADDRENEVIPFTIEIARDAMSAAVRFDEKRGNLAPDVSDVLLQRRLPMVLTAMP